jgi:hypothetical protein
MMDLFERVLLDEEVLPSMPATFSILLSHFSLMLQGACLHQTLPFFAESVYISTLSQGHQRTI